MTIRTINKNSIFWSHRINCREVQNDRAMSLIADLMNVSRLFAERASRPELADLTASVILGQRSACDNPRKLMPDNSAARSGVIIETVSLHVWQWAFRIPVRVRTISRRSVSMDICVLRFIYVSGPTINLLCRLRTSTTMAEPFGFPTPGRSIASRGGK